MQSLLSSHGGGLSAACVEGHAPRRPVCTTNTITPASSTLAPLSSMSLEERSPAARYHLSSLPPSLPSSPSLSPLLQGLLQMLQMFSEDTFPLLSSPGGLVSHPDIVDYLFRLCYR